MNSANLARGARPWVPPHLEQAIASLATRYGAMSCDALESEIDTLLDDHERHVDRECISLIAGTNLMNPRAAKVLAHSIGTRPSLGYPGDKYETGLEHAERIEIIAVELVRKLFGAAYAEIRVQSGSIANLYAYMATCKPGDAIMALPATFAGHVTHHAAGAAGLYGLTTHDIPVDAARVTIALDELRSKAKAVGPKLIIVAGSMCLYPFPVREVRTIADEVGARVMYDAAHMSGLIAGGAFQQPLAEGAHLVTASTYKSFGGPPSGMVLTNDAQIARRIDAIAYPGLTANFDLSKTAALALACLDLVEHGAAYAHACIANARALAAALHERGCPVFKAVEGPNAARFTDSQFVAVPAHGFGGGTRASRLIERANILTTGIEIAAPPVPGDFNAVRIGTQEVTRWGFSAANMPNLARLMCRVWLDGEAPESVRPDVLALRRQFQAMRYVR